jgi:hypothetical protein
VLFSEFESSLARLQITSDRNQPRHSGQGGLFDRPPRIGKLVGKVDVTVRVD